MKDDIIFLLKLAVSFLPFVLFVLLNGRANLKKQIRHRQYAMGLAAVVYSIVLLMFLDKLSTLCTELILNFSGLFYRIGLNAVGGFIEDIYNSWGIYITLVAFNTAAMLAYLIYKKLVLAVFGKIVVNRDSFIGNVVGLFYDFDEFELRWYIKSHFSQARTFIKAAYYGGCALAGIAMFVSCKLCMDQLVSAPFYPVFAVIIMGEIAFYIDGYRPDEEKSAFDMQSDKSRHIAMYPLLRKPLKQLFGDKLSAEGTTVSNIGITGGAIEDVLADLEQNDNIGRNYAAFVRKKMEMGLKPSVDYVRSGYDLSIGKSLLFNTPFYDKLDPYVFYAMQRALLTGGKVLIVLGRHGTEEDLTNWVKTGMENLSNVPDMWKVSVLDGQKRDDDALADIGIISRSGVHDLDVHKNSINFLNKVTFVFIVEPSRLVATAQIGLNLLVKCCGKNGAVNFCSVDRNCDGLVDALSHILMTNITEVSATEYPPGISSYMYWLADGEYLQHRIVPGVSRFLGMGTELSMTALKNQIKKAVWYGGEVFPVRDMHWIAKQYYYDLLTYANLPADQETFDKYFQASFNMCNEKVDDYSFVSVEDERNNLFEMRRNFATMARQQGFVNVISTEYMLREYMADNAQLFTADAKAIPYITADFARTRRNGILSLCLLMCVDGMKEDALTRQLMLMNMPTKYPVVEIWRELCAIFGNDTDEDGDPVIYAKGKNDESICFRRDETILFKREYSVESGKFENLYKIENRDFSTVMLDDLQNAGYVPEQNSEDVYIGTELKGHVYQKYLPGQFFTISGKYYEMISTTMDNRILVRRAADHIDGRLTYRQIRNYTFHRIEDSSAMGELKDISGIGICYQFADFSVETPGYWKLYAHNDFDNGDLVNVNGVPKREYHHKQVLKLDFSSMGDEFSDAVRITLTNLINEVFATLFADNQPFIIATTPGSYDAPLTYSLEGDENAQLTQKCIYIIEDSQLDIGLLVAVERNVNRILEIIADYLNWNEEKIEESMNPPEPVQPDNETDKQMEEPPAKKRNIFQRIGDWFKNLFKKKDKTKDKEEKEKKKEEKKRKKEEKRKEKEEKRRERKENRKKKKDKGEENPDIETATEPNDLEGDEPPTEEPAGQTIEEAISEQTDETNEATLPEVPEQTDEACEEPTESPIAQEEREVNDDEQP